MRKALFLSLLAVLAITAVLWWWVRIPFQVPDAELPPETGNWRRSRPLEGDPEELARLLSLPYAAGTQVATMPGLGVVEYDPDHAWDGLNLYVSGHNSEALLIDMEGVIKHLWEIQLIDAVPDADHNTVGGSYMRRVQLTHDGDLIVIWHEQGIARIDLRSRLEWSRHVGVYNDLFYSFENGKESLIAIHKLAEYRPGLSDQPVLNDHLLWLDPNSGETLRSLSLLDALTRSPWASALERRPEAADIVHTNAVTVLDENMVKGSPFQPGWVLFSLRELSLIGVLDPVTEDIVWALQGPPFAWQHEPVLLPGGPDREARMLLFDNKGLGDGTSRALETTLEGKVLWSWPDEGAESDLSLYSLQMGGVQRLPNGNTLIVESEGGSAVEVTSAGDVVWRFETPHRSGKRGQLVAVLPEMIRMPVPEWMGEAGGAS